MGTRRRIRLHHGRGEQDIEQAALGRAEQVHQSSRQQPPRTQSRRGVEESRGLSCVSSNFDRALTHYIQIVAQMKETKFAREGMMLDR